LIYTDAAVSDPCLAAAAISDLRKAGMKVFGLLDSAGYSPTVKMVKQLFGPEGYALLDYEMRLTPFSLDDRPILSPSDQTATPCPCAQKADTLNIEQ
jgi:hypothetical protein